MIKFLRYYIYNLVNLLFNYIDLDFFIHQHHTHEAYSNRRMEHKVVGIRLQHDEQTINPNFVLPILVQIILHNLEFLEEIDG